MAAKTLLNNLWWILQLRQSSIIEQLFTGSCAAPCQSELHRVYLAHKSGFVIYLAWITVTKLKINLSSVCLVRSFFPRTASALVHMQSVEAVSRIRHDLLRREQFKDSPNVSLESYLQPL